MLSLSCDDLDRPAQEATRRLALGLLDEAAAALERLGGERDSEALHDFRVALRRLRSLLRAYRNLLRDTVSRKLRSRLKELARATGAGRDAEVELAWLKSRKESLPARSRPAQKWLARRLSARLEEAYATIHETIAGELRGLEKTLRRRLSYYRVDLRSNGEPSLVLLRAAAAERIREHAEDLRAHAEAIRAASDKEALHEARICSKRLRYILEPFGPVLDGANELIERLKSLQDILGDLNDRNVLTVELAAAREAALLEEKGPAAQISSLASRVAEERRALEASIEADWLGGAIPSLAGAVIGLTAALAPVPAKGVEIERKFLLSRLPPEVRGMRALEVDQGWIPGSAIEERARRLRDGEQVRYFRTIKAGKGLRRLELEEETTPTVFEALWRLTRGHRVKKFRYKVPEGGLVWEIDKFSGRKLILAEVELPTEGTPVEIPAWLAPHVVREVTGVEEYYNVNLAR